MAQRSTRATDVWLEPASWEDRRSGRRHDADLPAVLHRPNHFRSKVTMRDISMRGCRVEASNLRAGDRVWLYLEALEPVCASVAWASLAEAGLEFRLPLHPAVVTHVVTRGQATASPD